MNQIQADLNVNKNWKLGVVTSRFNSQVTELLESGAMAKLQDMGIDSDQIVCTRVPGAYELPVAAKWLLEQGCHGVITLGAVIQGETSHFDYVCTSVERGCTELQLSTGKPVVFGVLTTQNSDLAFARCGGAKGHKGQEVAEVLVEMLNLKAMILA